MQSIESEAHVDSESAPVDAAHRRPEGVTDADVKALGLLSEALETVEQARGNLYAFHQLSGRGDLQLQDAVKSLREAGHAALADRSIVAAGS